MCTTTREAARVDAFVASIRASAHPNHRPAVDDTVELPRIVATSTPLGASHPEPALVDRLPLWAIVALFVAVFAPAVILFGMNAAPHHTSPAVVELGTADEVVELGAGRVVR